MKHEYSIFIWSFFKTKSLIDNYHAIAQLGLNIELLNILLNTEIENNLKSTSC